MLQKWAVAVLLSWASLSFANPEASAPAEEEQGITLEQFMASLNFQEGTITLPGDIASINLGEQFRYLSAEDTERVLVAWGNPPGNDSYGMLVPTGADLFDETGWAVIISYEEDGYVSDADADSIDYAELLRTMQEDTRADNEARVEAGYEAIELVGWAAPPRYDSATHKLYWAKELHFGSESDNTLNYNIRVLGRRGVLVLNAVATMSQLAPVETGMQQVLAITEFNDGHRYADFDPDVDTVAAYGIGALVAGKLAAKAGLFAKLAAFLFAFKKFIIIGLVALGALMFKLFKRKTA